MIDSLRAAVFDMDGTLVVFEDAANGVRAAKAAGMLAVGITTASSADELRDAGASFTAADFASLPQALLLKLGIAFAGAVEVPRASRAR